MELDIGVEVEMVLEVEVVKVVLPGFSPTRVTHHFRGATSGRSHPKFTTTKVELKVVKIVVIKEVVEKVVKVAVVMAMTL